MRWMSDETQDDPEQDDSEDGKEPNRFQRFGEQLTGLLDPEAAFRRGSGLVTGVTQATKEEFVRIVSAEMRNFLDGMDAADLLQQAIAGLVIDVNMQVKFSRDADGATKPEVTHKESKVRMSDKRSNDEPQTADEGESRASKSKK